MTTKGFRAAWRRQKKALRNATGGRITTERKKLVRLVANELRAEMKAG